MQPLFEHRFASTATRPARSSSRATARAGAAARLGRLGRHLAAAAGRLGARDRRAIAVDLPGFGHASRLGSGAILPQLDAFAGALVEQWAGDGEVVVVGNSLGGVIALRLAERADLPLAGSCRWRRPGCRCRAGSRSSIATRSCGACSRCRCRSRPPSCARWSARSTASSSSRARAPPRRRSSRRSPPTTPAARAWRRCSPPGSGCCPSWRRRRSTSTASSARCCSCGARATAWSRTRARRSCSTRSRHPRRAARGRRALPAARGDRAAAGAAAAVPRRGHRSGMIPLLGDGVRGGGRERLRRDAGRGPRRPAPDALDGDRRGAAAHRPPLPPRRGRAAPPPRELAAGAARAAARRAGDLLRPAARLLGRRAPRAGGPADLPRRLRRDRVRRPRARPRALDRGRRAGRDPRRLRGRRRPPGAGRRLVPRRHPLAARARRRPGPAGRLGGADREPVRLLQGPAGRAAAPDRGGHRRRRDHAALPPARAARPRRWSSAATSWPASTST